MSPISSQKFLKWYVIVYDHIRIADYPKRLMCLCPFQDLTCNNPEAYHAGWVSILYPNSVTAWLVLVIDVKYLVIKIPVGFWVFVGFCILLIASSQQSLHAVRSALIICRSLFRFSWTSGANVSSWWASPSASHPDSSFSSIFCILRGQIGFFMNREAK